MSAFNKHIVSGRVGRKPELRYTPSGTAVTSFSLARQPRRLNQSTGQWEDGDLTWYDVAIFRNLAENVVASIDKGVEVTVIGEIKLNSYTTKDNEQRQTLELIADDVTISLDHQIVEVKETRAYGTRVGGGTNGGGAAYNGNNNGSSSYQAPSSAASEEEVPF